jgi:branched-chain amino acid transport system substrate-binding protein
LVKVVREGNTRGLFKDRAVVSFLTGEPEYLDPLKDETPEGWIVTGYPWYSIKTPEHDAFLKAYQAKYNDYPRLGSIVGYQTMKSAAAILAKAKSDDPDKLIAAAEGLSVPSPFGEITFRKIDHQSTLGAFVGKTALKDGKGIMVDSVYRKGADYLPSDDEVAFRFNSDDRYRHCERSEAIQVQPQHAKLDCLVAEPVIGRAFARRWLPRNDEKDLILRSIA